MIDENFQYRLSCIGAPENSRPMNASKRLELTAHLPPNLVEFLDIYGFGEYLGGMYRMCEPDEFKSILALVLAGDRDFSHKDCYVLGHTAFGVLWCWSERWGNFEIDLPSCMLFCRTLTNKIIDVNSLDISRLASAIIPKDADDVDYYDVYDAPMYGRCIAKFGVPAYTECFGFFPALSVAGVFGPNRSVENIRRVQAREHFAILAQLDTFHLTEIGRSGYEAVRPIG